LIHFYKRLCHSVMKLKANHDTLEMKTNQVKDNEENISEDN